MKNYSDAACELSSFQANSLIRGRDFIMTPISINTRPKANANHMSI